MDFRQRFVYNRSELAAHRKCVKLGDNLDLRFESFVNS